jgi:hypothetical protein
MVKNRTMRICFQAGWVAALAVAGLQAGGTSLPSGSVSSVVRPDPRTGRLVRSVVVRPRVPAPAAPLPKQPPAAARDFSEAVEQVAREHRLPPQLIHSIIKVESNYNPFAVSPKGALGLMQLIPATARRFGVSDVFDPMENLQGGARYLKYLLNLYDGDDRLALAAYNAGEGAVARWGGVPPYRETQGYLRQVRRGLEEMQAQAPRPEAPRQPSAPGAVPSVPAQNSIREVMDADGRVRYISQ